MRANLATVRHRPGKPKPWLVVIRVGTVRRSTSHPSKTAANRFAARLNTAVNAGEEFDPATGEPAGWVAGPGSVADAAAGLLAEKWPAMRAPSRRALVEACGHVVAACGVKGRADVYRVAVLALGGQDLSPRDKDLWRSVQQTSPPVGTVNVATVCRVLATNLDGTPAAVPTVRRRRQALAQVVEHGTGARPDLPAAPRGTRAKGTVKVKPSRIGTVADAVATIDRVGPHGAQLAFALMLWAGLRPAEACGLRWQHVDLDGGVLTVCETRPGGGSAYTDGGGRTDVQPPKWRADGGARTVPLVGPLRWALTVAGVGTGPVAPSRTGGHYSTSALGHLWARARQVEDRWPADRLARPYDLRHTHATLALNAGIPVPEVAARLGHAPAMLLDTYADVVAADTQRWTSVLGAAFG